MDHLNMGGEYHNEENIVDTSLPSELQPKRSYTTSIVHDIYYWRIHLSSLKILSYVSGWFVKYLSGMLRKLQALILKNKTLTGFTKS